MMLSLVLLTLTEMAIIVSTSPFFELERVCPQSPIEWDAYTLSTEGDPDAARNALIDNIDLYTGRNEFSNRPEYRWLSLDQNAPCAVRLLILHEPDPKIYDEMTHPHNNSNFIILYEDFRARTPQDECKKDTNGNYIMGCFKFSMEDFIVYYLNGIIIIDKKLVPFNPPDKPNGMGFNISSGIVCCFESEWNSTKSIYQNKWANGTEEEMLEAIPKMQELRRRLVINKVGADWEVIDGSVVAINTPNPHEVTEGKGLGVGEIIGIVMAVIVVILLITATLLLVLRKPPEPQTIAIAEGASQTDLGSHPDLVSASAQ